MGPPSGTRREVRPEIQALRGVAVLLVVVFHLWPDAVPGGFIGVDVFFVISGFLITGQLVREVERVGRPSVGTFWARRARRILPAAMLVLAVCAVATFTRLPATRWDAIFEEILASALYIENWELAGAAVDYHELETAPSPVRHFWTLSVEEQFYLVWPMLILLALAMGRRWIAPALGAVTLASFAWSLHATGADPASAFFATTARAWEFGVGGLLAVAAAGRSSRLLSALGLLLIGAGAFALSGDTPFPGVGALLPVAGALAVIRGGALRARPLEELGDISYSVYLWHWPLIVFAPGAGPVALLGLSLAAGWATKVAVEDPVRRLRVAPRWTFAGAAVATAAVVLIALAGTAAVEDRVRRDRETLALTLADPPPCFGAAAMATNCAPPRGVVPSPVLAAELPNAFCRRLPREGLVSPCTFGAAGGRARRTIALIGDSHAVHWRSALAPVAARNGWRGISITRLHCPLSDDIEGLVGSDRAGCLEWREQVPRWLERHPEISTVFVGQHASGRHEEQDFLRAWRWLPSSVRRIVVLRDTPQMLSDGWTLACVHESIEAAEPPGSTCRRSRSRALPPDPAAAAAEPSARATVVDMTRFFCDLEWCRPVIGGVLVYKDATHVTEVYGRTLAPYLRREVDRALGVGGPAAADAR